MPGPFPVSRLLVGDECGNFTNPVVSFKFFFMFLDKV